MNVVTVLTVNMIAPSAKNNMVSSHNTHQTECGWAMYSPILKQHNSGLQTMLFCSSAMTTLDLPTISQASTTLDLTHSMGLDPNPRVCVDKLLA
jgi:hypothetical protein